MSTRKQQKEALRQERIARERAAAEAAQRKRLVGYGVGGALAVAAVIAVVVALAAGGGDEGPKAPDQAGASGIEVAYSDNPPDLPQPRGLDLKQAANAAGCRLVKPPNQGANHVTGDVTYKTNPPTSGSHDQVPTEDGAYTQPPRTENTVHALEHGRVNIQFKPSLAQAQIDQLKALFDEDSYHLLLFPNGTRMPYEVAATAWDNALFCRKMSDGTVDAIRAFKDQYRDQGPEFVP